MIQSRLFLFERITLYTVHFQIKTLQDVFIHLHTAWKVIFKNP